MKKQTRDLTPPGLVRTKKYSTAEVAELLGVHRTTIRRYAEGGYLKCGYSRQNGRRFFTGEQILNFYNSQL